MSMAPPGKFSGTYYIILGNIPKKKKDYDLKKFVERSGIAVENAHVHPNLGCGYVSVRGGEDGIPFFQLGNWLQQAEWEGKTLQVDMRNYDHETALGPGLHPSLKSPADRSGLSNHSPTGPDGNTMSPGAYQVQYAQYQPQAQVSASPAYGTVQGGYAQQYTYINIPMTYAAAPTMQAPASATNHMIQGITPPYQYAAPSQFQSAPADPQQQVPMTYSQSSYSAGSPTATMQQPASQARPANMATVPISNRLLHCIRVQRCDSKADISRKVLSVLSSKEVNPIEHLWIPTRTSDGSEKGYALILMRTRGLAEKVVSKLKEAKVTGKDGKKRSMKFKIAQDGVSDADLAELNADDSLAGQMNNMSLQTPVTCTISEEGTEQSGQSFDDSTALYETASDESAPDVAARDHEIPGTGRRRSSLPIVVGTYPHSTAKGVSEKVDTESKSSKEREKSSKHRHHSSSHHTSSSKTSWSSGSKKSRN